MSIRESCLIRQVCSGLFLFSVFAHQSCTIRGIPKELGEKKHALKRDKENDLLSTKRSFEQRSTDSNLLILWRQLDSAKNYKLHINRQKVKKLSLLARAAISFSTLSLRTFDQVGEQSVILNEQLGFGSQCSSSHKAILLNSFHEKDKIQSEIEGCQIIYPSASFQQVVEKLTARISPTLIHIEFTAYGVNLKEMSKWEWNQKDVYEIVDHKLKLKSSDELNFRSGTIEEIR